MPVLDPQTLAAEIAAAYASRRTDVTPPSARDAAFDLNAGYAVEAALARTRLAGGRKTVGLKVGFANKAVWRVMKLQTLVWARMYDDTVRFAESNAATVPIERMAAPKIEPEIVFKLKAPIDAGADAASALASVEWLALGFEIIDCVYTDWKFEPADFVAACGLHAALVVGEPMTVDAGTISDLVGALPGFTVRLTRNGQVAAQGSGRNSLRSPALCLAELAAAIAANPGAAPLGAGDLVSSGTLTDSQPMAAGDTWRAEVEGLALPALTLTTPSG